LASSSKEALARQLSSKPARYNVGRTPKDSRGERNAELPEYYKLVWHLGGSQTDIATLTAESIDWAARANSYARMKTGSQAMIHLGDSVAEVLRGRPQLGLLFPQVSKWRVRSRKAFIRRVDW